MNEELMKRHMALLSTGEDGAPDPVAADMYARLCSACEKRPEGMSDQDQMLVSDIAVLERLKQELYADIRARGVVEDFRNGRQRLKRDNRSVLNVRTLMDQQRKHLAELRLTPNSRKAAAVSVDDDGFDDF